MNEETQELVTRLFAVATAKLEDASALAASGQSPKHLPDQYTTIAENLLTDLQAAMAIIEAASVIVSRNTNIHLENKC